MAVNVIGGILEPGKKHLSELCMAPPPLEIDDILGDEEPKISKKKKNKKQGKRKKQKKS